MIEKSEVAAFVKTQLLSRIEYYDLYTQVDDLSAGGMINDIQVIDISYDTNVNDRTNFLGTILVVATKEVGVTRSSFTGTFEGYFDDEDIYLESASLDISSTDVKDSNST